MTNARELAGLVGGTLLNVTTGTDNLAVGKDAGTAITTGGNNVAIGYSALKTEDTTGNNTAIGYQALEDQNGGSENTSVGYRSLANLTSGTRSTSLGHDAGLNLNTDDCVLIGHDAGKFATTATNSTFIGSQAAQGVGATPLTGNSNTAVGESSGTSLQGAATLNTFCGAGSGNTITTGSNNTVIGGFNGNQGNLDIRTSSNNIVLSDGAGNVKIRTDINSSVRFGPRFDTISGSVGGAAFITEANNRKTLYLATTTSVAQPLVYFFNVNGAVGYIQTSGTATTYSTSSDYRLKENVDYTWDATTRLKQLKPARFNFIADADTTVDGFLAHEAATVVPEAVTGEKDAMKDEEYEVKAAVTDDDGNVVEEAVMGTRSVPDMQGIDQSKLVPLLVKTIQELEARITVLEG